MNLPLDQIRPRRAAGDHNLADAEPAQRARAPMLVHIGYHKTGSTWLQDRIFCDPARGLETIADAPRHRLVEDFVRPDALSYDPQATAERYSAYIEAARTRDTTLVLSHERLSGYPSSGGHDRAMIADRLKATFPDASILIVLREQRSLIRSMYSQHITDGGTESLKRFLNTPEPALGRKPSFSLAFYEFDRLIAHYQRLFWPDRVLALPFEMLARAPQAFVDRIAGFSGRPEVALDKVQRTNEKRPLLMQQIQRPLNALFYHNELSPGALFHIRRFHKRYARLRPLFDTISPRFLESRLERRLRDAIDRHVGTYFAASNARTERLTGLALQEYGYPVLKQE